MDNSRIQLQRAKVTVNATLMQLDYLLELINKLNMTDKQRENIRQQIHNIKVNNAGAVAMIDATNVMPVISQAI